MFCISFVVVTVKARIASLDPRLEQAAMDLYANELETFRKVTLPLVAPGIAGAAFWPLVCHLMISLLLTLIRERSRPSLNLCIHPPLVEFLHKQM
jgi:ABC-type spermidine/putrescine transport system permease subunit II